MRYQIKIRVHRPDGTRDKIAFEIGADEAIPLPMEALGLALSSVPCHLLIHDCAVWIVSGLPGPSAAEDPQNPKERLIVNGQSGESFSLKLGDKLLLGENTIEFYHLPKIEPVEPKTRYIQVSPSRKSETAAPAPEKDSVGRFSALERQSLPKGIIPERPVTPHSPSTAAPAAHEPSARPAPAAVPEQPVSSALAAIPEPPSSVLASTPEPSSEQEIPSAPEAPASSATAAKPESPAAVASPMSVTPAQPELPDIPEPAPPPQPPSLAKLQKTQEIAKPQAASPEPPDVVDTPAPSAVSESATAIIMRSDLSKAKGEPKQKKFRDTSPDSATAMIMRSDLSKETSTGGWAASAMTHFIHRPRNDVPLTTSQLVKHIAMSMTMIAFMSELGMLIAMGFRYELNPVPTPYTALASMILSALVAGIMVALNQFFGLKQKFHEYLRFLAWCSLLSVPWAFAFAFHISVIMFGSFLVAVIWIGAFTIRYAPNRFNFVLTSSITWAGTIFASYHLLMSAGPAIPDNGHGTPVNPSHTTPADPVYRNPASTPDPQNPPDQVRRERPQSPAGPSTQQSSPSPQSFSAIAPDTFAQARFFEAVKRNQLSEVRSFVEKRAVDPIFAMEHGTTALHFAASYGYLEMVKYLISRNVNVNAQDPSGTTPLMWSVYKGHRKVVEYLIRKGADPRIKREDGDTAMDIAIRTDQKQLLEVLTSSAKSNEKKERRLAGMKTEKESQKKKDSQKGKSRKAPQSTSRKPSWQYQ